MRGAGITSLMDSAVASCATPGAWQASLPGEDVSVQAARRFVRDTLSGCPRADDLAQAVTELASNAVNWSAAGEAGTFTVAVRTAPRWVRVEVTDPGPAAAPAARGNGWGLGIVAAVTDRHGTRHGPGPVRMSWAEVTWPGPPPAGEDSHHAR
ncbi:MAG TPA: ATP-binding protein [Streptosporangiaceae bacterium]|nr:ATP-binding protein [Streptosporangiaceae bacterium]